MLKVCCLLCFWILSITTINADYDDEEEEVLWIESITYEWYLWSDTIIDIKWTKLDECDDIYIDWKPIFVAWKSESKISFNYSSVDWPLWYWELKCDSKDIKFFYKFPYIESAEPRDIENFKRQVEVTGENFSHDAVVVIEGSTFEIVTHTTTTLVWLIAKDTNEKDLYVEVGWLKSNKVNIEIAIPEVHFAYAPDWFYPRQTLLIWGTNISDAGKTTLFINEEEYDYSIDWDTQSIKTTLDREPWTYNVEVEHNGISSNSLELIVLWDKPVIKRWYKSTYAITEESNIENAFSLDMVDVEWDIEGIKVWHNGVSYDVDYTTNNRLFVNNIELANGVNYFYVESHGTFSDVYEYDNGEDLYFPFIRELELDWLSKDDTQRVIRVSIWYFDEELDTLYLDNSEVSDKECLGNVCTVMVPVNTLYWNFNVEREGIMSLVSKDFDVRNKTVPYIESVTLLWINKGERIKVVGNNFYEGEFSDWDLFSHNDSDNAVFDQSSKTIIWKLQNTLDADTTYNLWFTQYWETASNSFTLDDFTLNNTIVFPPKIISAWVQNEVFAWDEIKIYWFGFSWDDSITIGWNTLYFNKVIGETNRTWYVDIPDYFPLWTFELSVTNESWKNSKTISITVLPPRDEVAVNIESKGLWESYYKNEILSSSVLQTVSIGKLYSDVIIEKIGFTIESPTQNSVKDMWTFSLYYNNRQVWYAHVETNGDIIFDTPFEIKQNTNSQTLELRKKSPFTYGWIYKITLDSTNFAFQSKKTQLSLEAQFQNIMSYSFTILPQKSVTCIESSLSTNDICNTLSWDSWISHSDIIRESSSNTVIENTVTTISSWYKWELERTIVLLQNFKEWNYYVTKIQGFLPNVATTKLQQVQQKLKAVDMNTLANKPMLESLVYFLKAAVDYELSIR